jgi:hypothetical protein
MALGSNSQEWTKANIQLAPKPLDFDSEGTARLALLKKCPHGTIRFADPDGTLISTSPARLFSCIGTSLGHGCGNAWPKPSTCGGPRSTTRSSTPAKAHG